mgnify:CR=1 FL=1
MKEDSRVYVGIDVGGTFTDLVMFDPQANELRTVKVPSSPPEFWPSVVQALKAAGIDEDRPATILHGTTVHLNAFLERKGAKTALLTTKGFRDVYEMRRGNRPTPYDMHFRYPDPLVPRKHVFEVTERVAADGSVLVAPTAAEVEAIAEKLKAEGIESVAICFLHSYANPENEAFVAETLRQAAPDLFVTASHEVCREWREYERTSTTVINAYGSPVLKRYLSSLTKALSAWKDTRLFLLQSNGGLISAREAESKGILTLLSGPVGGNVAGRALAALSDDKNLICVDMGGTSFEASLVVEGDSAIRTEREVGGFPILAPMVDIHTIGAGGGSIAWNDSGALRVGPHSAGARPGPAGYGFGGTEATVTDSNLALGRLNDESAFGSNLTLKPQLAREAVARIGGQFGLGADVAAQGILDVINEQMANAIRTITVRRGIDPRTFALVAYGGAGPMHAADIARLLGIRKVIVPQSAGAFSAWGMIQSDLIHDVAESRLMLLAEADWAALDQRFSALEAELGAILLEEGATRDRIEFIRQLDIRYVGQEYSISVPLDAALFASPDAAANDARVKALFSELYEKTFGHSNPEEALEVSALRLRAIGRSGIDRSRFSTAVRREERQGGGTRVRKVLFDGQALDTPFIARVDMPQGKEFPGPVVVEESTCTTIVPPDFVASIDERGNLVLALREIAQ